MGFWDVARSSFPPDLVITPHFLEIVVGIKVSRLLCVHVSVLRVGTVCSL